MKQIDRDLYLIDEKTLINLMKQPLVNPGLYFENQRDKSLKGSIVLTVEELEDVFNRGGDYALMPMGYPNFKQYLQSKGINI